MSDFAHAANIWAARHPEVVTYTTKLVERGVKAAVFSSVVRAIAGIAIDAEPYHQGDVDLLIVQRDLEQAQALLPEVTASRNRIIRNSSVDGTRLWFVAREVTGRAGADEIQFVAPHTPLMGLRRAHHYNTAYTDAAHQESMVIETDNGLLPVAHMAYTAGMYGILQRPKGDAEKLQVVLAASDVVDDPYTPVCAEQMSWDNRVWRFIEEAGQGAIAAQCSLDVPEAQVA
jgi:hypothetical protein